MKPEYRTHWSRDDHELSKDFADVSESWLAEQDDVPDIPTRLDRKIKQLAHHNAMEQLQKNWIFGTGPQLIAVISIFFAIGLYYVIDKQENKIQHKIESSPLESALELSTSSTVVSNSSWVRLSFLVNNEGRATLVRVIERCARRQTDGQCVDDVINDAQAMAQVRQKQYLKPGHREEVVIIPPSP